MVGDILSEMRRGQISRLVIEYRGSDYPSEALSVDKCVLYGKKKEKMSSQAKKTLRQTKSSTGCSQTKRLRNVEAGENSPKRKGGKKIKAISSDICQGRRVRTLLKTAHKPGISDLVPTVYTTSRKSMTKAATPGPPLRGPAASHSPRKQQAEYSESWKQGH